MTSLEVFMNQSHIAKISDELSINPNQTAAVAQLLTQGATVPFIARYRKEATGSLDETAITAIRDRLNQLHELDERKTAVLKSLEDNGHLTEELEDRVNQAETLALLEDIYLPFRPKRRTRATIAREKGLEPLALLILEQACDDLPKKAFEFIDGEKEITTVDEALAGARDIIAEMVNEDETARKKMRMLFFDKGVMISSVATGMEEKGLKYRDYYDWQEPVKTAPSHRILAMRRGEKEDVLNLSLSPPEDRAVQILEQLFVKGDSACSEQVKLSIQDSYRRLLSRSMETEVRLSIKNRADTEAIQVFSQNLRELLLAPPLGPKRVMGIDPGFRTGCKVICLDRQGKFLDHATIYPHMSKRKASEAVETVVKLCDQYRIEAIGIGNGTAGRETETFLRDVPRIKDIPVIMVSESGASIYSASEIARKEFPDLDLTIRGAISIGRRLMDPLAELVKIDPKSIGVGQYQHDVDQIALKHSLDDAVISCVNAVGVDVNRASAELLTYVSGLGPQLARNIVIHRDQNGSFRSRTDLKKVSRLGPKAFEQSAGFLRITGGENPLDASAVHPESYEVVHQMSKDTAGSIQEMITDPRLKSKIDLNRYVSDTIGIPTLKDILDELIKPGRDPRREFEVFDFQEGINRMEDLTSGMKLPGIITNVTAFGAFVDIGVHQDGLVHISEMSDQFVKNPVDVVKVHQKVMVTVIDVDIERKRISLSMKTSPVNKSKPSGQKQKSKTAGPKKRGKMDHKKKPFHNPFAEAFGRN